MTLVRAYIQFAADCGWHRSEAARQLNCDPKEIDRACKEFGITLPKHNRAPTKYSGDKEAAADRANDTRVKAWSAKPSAIAKALDAAQSRRTAMIGAKP